MHLRMERKNFIIEVSLSVFPFLLMAHILYCVSLSEIFSVP
jgi:hypothetical protein